jgi:2-polyprenyl-3-methyl-5-hydroxy-6-metoxy-1,4-benzoquinol methylase
MSESNHSHLLETPSNANSQQHSAHQKVLMDYIMGFRATQLLALAARLNLAEYLSGGAKTALQLSQVTNTNTQALYRLLRALSNLGIVEKNEDGTFSITPSGRLLCENAPGSVRNVAILYGEHWLWQAYARLSYSVEQGKQAFEFVHRQTLYNYLQKNSPASDAFNRAMSDFSNIESESIKNAYSFSEAQSIVDVGGGQGVLVSSILKANLHISAIVFDLPEVINTIATESITQKNSFRISYARGDFFSNVPAGGDIYLLKSVLHNWDDASCISILRNCHKAMAKNAKLLIIERIIPDGNEKSESKLFDINMLVMTGGQERTKDEYKKLLDVAGFYLLQVISTHSPMSILECSPKL